MTHESEKDVGGGKGLRVVAIRGETDDTVYLYGYGHYVGDEIAPGLAGTPWASRPNPKIVLDDGTVVWGYQCWWAPIDRPGQVEENFPGKRVVVGLMPGEDPR